MSLIRWISRLVARTVVVHTTQDASIRGILVGEYRDCLVLKHSVYLGTLGGERLETPIDGEVVVPREQVAWIQTLPSGEVK